MQADRRLVEDVQHADETAADLRREPNPLGLAARERYGGPLERQIVEADVHEEAQPVVHFLQNGPRDFGIQPGTTARPQRDLREKVERFPHGERDDFADALAGDQDRQALRFETAAAARGAWLFDHELLELLAHRIGRRFAVALVDVIEHALPARFIRAMPALAVVLIGDRLSGRAVEQNLLDRGRQITPRGIEIELVCLGERGQHHFPYISARLTPRQHDTLENRQTVVAQHELGVHLAPRAESRAVGTGTVGRVERELPRLELGQRQPAFGTRIALGEHPGPWAAGLTHDLDHAVGRFQRGLDRVGEPAAVPGTYDQPIDDHGDVVVLALVQLGHVCQIIGFAVDADTHEALFAHRLEDVAKFTLAPTHQWREHLDLGALRPLEHEIGDL